MDKVVIGTYLGFAKKIEKSLPVDCYTKQVWNDFVYFNFDYIEWDHPDDNQPTNLMNFLFNEVGYDNYGFVRLGEEADDTEIHGCLESFGMQFKRKVTINNE